ncbi:MAG: YncE family protein [Burkholderiaceae bacterium]|nr:YncE family protein [Burkholderiaceae bacterium]
MKKTLCLLALHVAVASAFAAPTAAPGYKVTGSIAIGGEARWDYITVDSEAHRIYMSHGTQTEVIDTQSNKLIATIPDTLGVHGIVVARDLGLGYISNGKDNSVTVFDLATLKATAKIKVGTNPDAIVYEEKSHRVVTFNGKSEDATVIDAKTGAVVGTIAIGDKPEFAQIDPAGTIYVNGEHKSELDVIDAQALKLTHRYTLKPCESPSGLAIDDKQRLYAVCDNDMMVVSATDGKRLGQPKIGGSPDGVAWMDGFAFSANGEDGTVSVVGETAAGKFETVATVATAFGARTIAADPATHKLYVPAADFAPASGGGKRQGMPGTFRILVLEKQ